MFDKFRRKSPLDPAIDRVLESLTVYDPTDAEYQKLLNQLSQLQTLRRNGRTAVTGDTLAVAGANVLAVLIIVAYERANVMTSKGLGLLLRKNLN